MGNGTFSLGNQTLKRCNIDQISVLCRQHDQYCLSMAGLWSGVSHSQCLWQPGIGYFHMMVFYSVVRLYYWQCLFFFSFRRWTLCCKINFFFVNFEATMPIAPAGRNNLLEVANTESGTKIDLVLRRYCVSSQRQKFFFF